MTDQNTPQLTEEQRLEQQRKHAQDVNKAMKKLIFWGAVKLLVLSAISAGFVYWYMFT